MFSPEQIKDRKVVWLAFADLFLDTDVSLNYKYICQTCASSKFSIAELELILKNEVAPVVKLNLYSVAGEWAGFDEDWLIDAICKRQKKSNIIHDWFQRFKLKFGFTDYTQKQWLVISPLIEKLREND